MKHQISVTVNGTAHEAEVESRLLLVHFIREELRLTGTHIGCDTSHCGVCTVLLDGQPVKSCTVLAAQVDGCKVSTVEGLESGGKLHPIQEAFTEKHALQCGYCTPGMLVAALDLVKTEPEASRERIREHLSGNYCRCTGYEAIVDAIETVMRGRSAR